MIQADGFKQWLKDCTSYSDSVIGDTVSRAKRADSILCWDDSETYLFYLERQRDFELLSVSVRSQLRKAIKLYALYIGTGADGCKR